MFEITKERLSFPLPAIEVTNLEDETLADAGMINQDSVRSITISDWRIDRALKTLSIPRSSMELLGITRQGFVRLSIQDTEIPLEAGETPDGTPASVGQIPLEFFDLTR